jgi:hypothetical protein
MSFSQVYYTSCRAGLGSGAGFQINAATPGLSAADLRAVERLGTYVPPPTAPPAPTEAEIAQLPAALYFGRLPDGAAVLGQTRYVGKGPDGRYGNYFAHTLVTRDVAVDFAALLPIELWGAPHWTTSPSATTDLPPLTPAPGARRIDRRAALAFLHAGDGTRLAQLPAFLTAVEQALQRGRRLIVIDEGDGPALWIALASYSLPRSQAFELSFRTYERNPGESSYLVVGTTPDTDARFTGSDLRSRYSVFDFAGRQFTTFSQPGLLARRAAAAWQARDEAELDRLTGFLERVGLAARGDALTAVTCYDLARGTRPTPEEGSPAPADLITWCAEHLAQLRAEELEAALASAVAEEPATVGAALDELLRAAATCRADDPRVAVAERLQLGWALETAGHDAATLERLARDAPYSARVEERARTVAALWRQRLDEAPDVAVLAALMRLGVRVGLAAGDGPLLERLTAQRLAPAIEQPAVQQLLVDLGGTVASAGVLAAIFAELARRAGDSALFDRLAGFLDREPARSALAEWLRRKDARALRLDLALRARRARSEPARRVEIFCAAADDVRQAWGGTPAAETLVRETFAAIWRDAPPAAAEARAVLEALEERDGFALSALAEGLSSALGPPVSLTRPDEAAGQLARALEAPRAQAGLSAEARIRVRAHGVAADARRGNLKEQDLIGILAEADALPPEWATRLRQLVMPSLARLADEAAHARLLTELLSSGDGAVYGAYVDAARDIARNAEIRKRLLRVWGAATFSLTRKESLVENVIDPTVDDFTRDDDRDLSLELGERSAAAQLWEGCPSVVRRRTAARRRRIIVWGVAIALLAAAAGYSVQRWVIPWLTAPSAEQVGAETGGPAPALPDETAPALPDEAAPADGARSAAGRARAAEGARPGEPVPTTLPAEPPPDDEDHLDDEPEGEQ